MQLIFKIVIAWDFLYTIYHYFIRYKITVNTLLLHEKYFVKRSF